MAHGAEKALHTATFRATLEPSHVGSATAEVPALSAYPDTAEDTAWSLYIRRLVTDHEIPRSNLDHGFHPNTLIPALLAILAQLVAPWEP
jgi:hypothetical protein